MRTHDSNNINSNQQIIESELQTIRPLSKKSISTSLWNQNTKYIEPTNPWCDEEDRLLREAVNACGPNGVTSWNQIANDLEGRTPKECRYRYTRYLVFKKSESERTDKSRDG